MNCLFVGGTFSLGLITVDGLDGYNTFVGQRSGGANSVGSLRVSNYLSMVVIVSSYSLAAAELAKVDMDRYALPGGVTLFAVVLCLRLWIRRSDRKTGPQPNIF